VLEHIFRYFKVSFHDFFLKDWIAEISYEAVTLQMMRNNCMSAPVINAHWLTEEAYKEYSSDCRN
jgi:hypothetical protein